MNQAPVKITELRLVKKRLQESEHRYRMLVEQSPDNIVIHDLEGTILFTNASRVEVLGAKSPDEIIGKNAMLFVHPDDRDFAEKAIAKSLDDYSNDNFSIRTIEHRFVRLDGSVFYGEATGVPFFFNGDLAMQVIVRDISKRKDAEEALKKLNDSLEKTVAERTAKLSKSNELLLREIQERKAAEIEKGKIQKQLLISQKMEAMGKFTSGIAHDFNNIMTIIKTFSTLALKENTRDNSTEIFNEYLTEINAASNRAANLTRQLLLSVRSQPAKPEHIKVNSIIDEMNTMFRHILAENISIETKLEEKLFDICADRGNIEQVIMNLVLNARDSIMARPGTITIETANESFRLDDIYSAPIAIEKPGQYIRLTVRDTGVGMDSEVSSRLFEPFFTTKESGKGLGIGLTVVGNIVDELNGATSIQSESERGTTISIYLPASIAPQVNSIASTRSRTTGNGERILLVEDQAGVRKSIVFLLSESNYTIVTAANVEEALEIFNNEDGNFDLVFTDVTLPGRSGVELAREILSIRPDTRILFSSGYLDIDLQWPYIKNGRHHFIQKPFEQEDLISAIEKAFIE